MVRWRTAAGAIALAIFAAAAALAQDSGTPSTTPTNSAQPASAPKQEQGSQAPAEKPQRMRVGQEVAARELAHQVAPIYPPIAKVAHISGTVVLHCIIAKDGTVKQVEYVSGPPLLLKSAMDAVRQWVYKPTLLNDKAVEVDTTVTVVFELGGTPPHASSDKA